MDLTQQPGTSTGIVKGDFSVESLIKPEHWKHLPKYAGKQFAGNVAIKREVVEEEPVQETVEVVNLPPQGASNIIYVPKSVEQGSALVLMPQMQKRISNKRSNPRKPVPKETRDPRRHYCDNCTCNYKEKSDLNKHVHFMCMQTEYGFICDTCMMGFHTDFRVREHFYQEHKKEHLYFCTRCNKGFYHKSHRSNHKKSCPNKDQPEIYPSRAPVDEKLELTFKRRQRVPVEVANIAQQEIQKEQESELAAQCLEAEIEKEKEKEQEQEQPIGKKPKKNNDNEDDEEEEEDEDEGGD